jgi:hypothetical protein
MFRYPPRDWIDKLLRIAVIICVVVKLTQQFGSPVLAIYSLFVAGGIAIELWKNQRHR